MKKTVIMTFLILIAFQTVGLGQKRKEKEKVKADTITVDSLEYKLIILDQGFESWLATKPPKEFYTKSFYEQKNHLYVSEWNHRYITAEDTNLYETYIEYYYNRDYGLDLNYTLYYYFRYFEETNHVTLIPTGR
jgi:hypothetical protein